ncbi:M4 family metallopeptidase [Streptomyces sp. NPDC051018]|uniref:M4 family metallopeptidase n=1 Tax=Streptomyces sp. NPDC051018 TaxID=3365639 RepID=UPI0037A4973D
MSPTSPKAVGRRARTATALVAAGVVVAVGVQVSADATTPAPSGVPAASRAILGVLPAGSDGTPVDPGALPAATTPQERTALIRKAERRRIRTAREIGLGPGTELRVKDVVENRDGTTHTRYEQVHRGLPVLGGQLIVHRGPDGAVDNVDRATRATRAGFAAVATTAPVTKKPKAATAKGSRAPRTVIWAGGDKPVLAWERVVGGIRKDGTPNELHIVTDALTGKKLSEFQGVQTGSGHSQYSGTVRIGTAGSPGSYTLTDTARGGHTTVDARTGALFKDTDDTWGDGTPANPQTAAVDAHYGAALTWDYFKNVHGRNGIRGDGVGASSRVHYGNGYVNAFWNDTCFCMTYGDGVNNRSPLTAVDVAAHEMTHGVTSHTAGLVYDAYDAGGLNEATSDIFATAVEFYAGNATDPADYLTGEKIDINGDGTPLRYMDEPSKDGGSMDNWRASLGVLDPHYSSGIANHFFYLLSEGGGAKTVNGVRYNSPTFDNLPVPAIGIGKAEKIWFKALTEKMLPNETFAAARQHTLEAAGELYGANSPEQKAVGHAWAAVNVGTRPDGPWPSGPSFENRTRLSVPDLGRAVVSPVTVTGVSGNAPTSVRVTVDIKHPFRGDLDIALVAPDGTVYQLKTFTADGTVDLKDTFAVNASAEVANGTWKLQVRDAYPGNTGFLDSWKLTF